MQTLSALMAYGNKLPENPSRRTGPSEWQPYTSLHNHRNACKISALIDESCECYTAIDETLANSISLPTVKKVS